MRKTPENLHPLSISESNLTQYKKTNEKAKWKWVHVCLFPIPFRKMIIMKNHNAQNLYLLEIASFKSPSLWPKQSLVRLSLSDTGHCRRFRCLPYILYKCNYNNKFWCLLSSSEIHMFLQLGSDWRKHYIGTHRHGLTYVLASPFGQLVRLVYLSAKRTVSMS